MRWQRLSEFFRREGRQVIFFLTSLFICFMYVDIMAYPAKAVANEFLALAKADGKTISPMKLLKLVYFAHGWYLAFTGQPLIQERVEAWQYGPVISTLYHEFKKFGNDPITEEAEDVRVEGGKITPFTPRIDDENLGKALIAKVWQNYGQYSAGQLSSATHQEGTPWAQIYKPGERSLVIPDEVIKKYYDTRKTAGQ